MTEIPKLTTIATYELGMTPKSPRKKSEKSKNPFIPFQGPYRVKKTGTQDLISDPLETSKVQF